jgi:hypothetical protein
MGLEFGDHAVKLAHASAVDEVLLAAERAVQD